MAELTVHEHAPVFRVSIWQHVATAVLVLGFMASAWLRLNDCDLFNPDSPRYLIYAQSLAETGEYRAIDTPGAPLYTWRPPGLPILLAPVLRFFPYDVLAAKCVVLLSAALLLVMVHAVASSTRGGWSGPLMVAVVGTSPLFLSLATEVLSEVPYALGTLLVVYGISRWDRFDGRSHWTAYSVALVALAFTPIIRTIGVALVAAVGIWSLVKRRRWAFLPAVAAAVVGLVWLAWRSRSAPGSNYAGSLLQNIREHGLPTVLAEAAGTLMFYASAFPGGLLPGMTSEQPFYAPMVVGRVPSLNSFGWLVTFVAVIVTGLGLLGAWRQRHRGGLVVLLYMTLYIGCLAIWPWRHERFLWPLIPLIWAFLPTGCHVIGSGFPSWLRITARSMIACGVVILCAWQVWGSSALISTNQRFLADRDAFYRDEAPGFYFSDWRQAGRWIRENTPAHSRLLTWQAAVGGTGHRFQRRVQFETLDPEKIRMQITAFPARYLVIANCQFGLGFGWRQVFADPAFTLTPVYDARGVVVLEVSPNRTGSVSPSRYKSWLRDQRAGLDAVLARNPDRADLNSRKADLLQEEGENQQAIALLRDLERQGVVTVRVCSALGWLYMAERQYELSARYLDLARGLPNAEPIAQSLAEGAQRARERKLEPSDDSSERALERSLRRIQSQIASLNFVAPEREADRLLEQTPTHAAATYWRGYLHHLNGELEQAEAMYRRAVKSGSLEARKKLSVLILAQALELSTESTIEIEGKRLQVAPNSFQTHVQLARLNDEEGWPGRSLAILESARQRFGDRPEILSPLADLYLRFARPEEALPLFRTAQEAWPHEKSLRQGQSAAEAALREPMFP